MGNTNATSTTVEQDVKNVLEGKEEVSNEMLASLMWDRYGLRLFWRSPANRRLRTRFIYCLSFFLCSPPETLLAALKEDDLGLSEFVWLDKKQNSESDKGHERIEKSESDEARARRIAEIRRRIEEEVARRRMEMAQQEEEAAEKARNQAKKAKKSHDDALVLHCAHCSAPITKGKTCP